MDSFRKDTGNFLTAILNGTNYAIIATDNQGIIKAFNTGAEHMLGYTAEELIDKESVLVLHDLNDLRQKYALQNEGRNIVSPGFDTVIFKAKQGTIDDAEWVYISRDNTRIPVQVSISSISNHEGTIVGYVQTAKDITNRKRYEATLLKYKNDLEELERISRVGRWEVDLPHKTVLWSNEVYNIHEKPYSFVPDFESALSFYHGRSRDTIMRAVSECIENGTPYDVDLSIKSASGAVKYIRTKGEPVYDDNGKVVKVVGIFQDISKEYEAEKLLREYALDLEKKNEELDQFAYVVSHDLKAPLRGINNLSLWIQEDLEPVLSEETRKNLGLLRKRVVRMENLINGILMYAKAGRSKNEAVRFSVSRLISDVAASLTAGKNIAVNIVQPMPYMTAEKIKLEQVFSNLISNAIKYNSGSNPEVRITATEDEQHYTFCVADNGPGIDPAHHSKIFVIFQTLQSRDTAENTGVGLAIVKKIVEENGGSVWVESQPGEGAKFCFTWLK
jgi:PAS domain S-box-containing protein